MIVLDTNVMSETMRRTPMGRILDWIEANDSAICLSTVAIAEIAYGIFKIAPQERSPRWEHRLNEWRQRYGERTFSFDDEAADLYGRIMGRATLAGRSIEPIDGMIAATALRHGAALATRNVAHFQIDGLTVIDPWAA
jgi:predicted nucleic acid-binding protein